MDIKARLKNVYFWIGLVALFFTTIGIDPASMTTWGALLEAIKDTYSNPYLIGCLCVALVGYVTDTSTPGLSDGRTIVEEDMEKELEG